MNGLLLTAGLLASFTTLLHLIGGGRTVVRPFLAVQMDITVQRLLHACWHLVTVFLATSAATLLYAAFEPDALGSRLAVRFIAANYVLGAGVFLLLTLLVSWEVRWKRLPQWTLFLPIGLLAWWGAA